MINSGELLALSKLAMAGKESDVRLYLGKLVRKLRKTEPSLSKEIEELLRSQPARSSDVMRRGPERTSDSGLFSSSEGSSFPLLKAFNFENNQEEPLLDDQVRSTLEQVIAERNASHILHKKGLTPASSLIFEGPPGVGKTMTARWLASHLALPFYVLDLTAVMSSYLGKTGSNLRSVIEFAKSRPCVLLLDEIDAIAKKRSDEADVGELKRLVTVMLQELEEWPSEGLLIAATNHPELVDPALWRRFDLEVSFSKPSAPNTKKAVHRFLGKDLSEFTPWLGLITEGVEGESYSEIKRVVHKLRKLRILTPEVFNERIVDCLFPNSKELTRSDRIDIATSLVSQHGISQQKASRFLGVSRDTIRKRLTDKS